MLTTYRLPDELLNPLYLGYLEARADATRFYCGHFSQKDIFEKTALAVTQSYTQDRDQLVQVLKDINIGWGASQHTLKNLERLADSDAVVVIAGQQAGLLGGPLYTIYKALGAVKMANKLEAELKRPVVPVFWVASEDHDFSEIKELWLVDGESCLQSVTLELEHQGEPVGNVPLASTAVDEVMNQITFMVPTSEFSGDVLSLIQAAGYQSKTPVDWFARLMTTLFKEMGLIFFDPLHPKSRQMLSPFFGQVLDKQEEVRGVLARREKELLQAGYALQVERDPEATLLMHISHKRTALLSRDGIYTTRDGEVALTQQTIRRELDEQPEQFSPNVLLRPLAQDYLFPTICQLAGPGETAYFAQLLPLYDVFGLSAPVLMPRTGLTIVEPRLARYLERYSIPETDILSNLELHRARVLRDKAGIDLDHVFNTLRQQLKDDYDSLKNELSRLDQQLIKLADKNLERLYVEMGYLEKKAVSALNHKNGAVLRHFEALSAAFAPFGRLQERAMSIFPYMMKYGPDFLEKMFHEFPADVGHYLFYFQPGKEK